MAIESNMVTKFPYFFSCTSTWFLFMIEFLLLADVVGVIMKFKFIILKRSDFFRILT